MDDSGCIAKGEGKGGIYRALRDCTVTTDLNPTSAKAGKLKKKDEIVIVMRVRCAEGWCTEREMDGALNLEHIHGAKVGQMDEPAKAAGTVANSPSGRRKSVSVMSAQERQALRRASVDVAQQQLQTHLMFRDGDLGRGSSKGRPTLSSRRLLDGNDRDSPTATTVSGARRLARAHSSAALMGSIGESDEGASTRRGRGQIHRSTSSLPTATVVEEGEPPRGDISPGSNTSEEQVGFGSPEKAAVRPRAKTAGAKLSLAERLAAKKQEVERVRVEQMQLEEERARARKVAAESAAQLASQKAHAEAAELAKKASTSLDASKALKALAEGRGTSIDSGQSTRVLTNAEKEQIERQEAEWTAAAEAAVAAARVAEAAEQQLDEKQEGIESYLHTVPDDNPFKIAVDEPSFVRQLASTLKEQRVEAGDLLITKGEVGEEMFFITAGEAHVLTDLDDASPLANLGENDFCGEEALLLEAPRNAYVRASSDQALVVLALNKADLLLVLHGHPALADVILAPIAQRETKRAKFEARIDRMEAYVRAVPTDSPFSIAVNEPAFVRQLASTLRERSFAVGELLITKGEVGQEMFFITGGQAHVLSSLEDSSPIAELGPNDFCGEEALLMEAPRNAFVRVEGDIELTALALSKADLLKVLSNYPALADVILAPIAEREIVREKFEKARAEKLVTKGARKAQIGRNGMGSIAVPALAEGVDSGDGAEERAEVDSSVGSLADAAQGAANALGKTKERRGARSSGKVRRLSAMTLALPELPADVVQTGARHGTDDEVDTPLPRREGATPPSVGKPEPEPGQAVASNPAGVEHNANSPWARFSFGSRAFYQNSALRLRSLDPPPDDIGIKLSKEVGESGAPSREQFEKHYSVLCRRREMMQVAQSQPRSVEQPSQPQQLQHDNPPEDKLVDQGETVEVELDSEQMAWLASKQEQYDTLTARLAGGVPGPVRPHLERVRAALEAEIAQFKSATR